MGGGVIIFFFYLLLSRCCSTNPSPNASDHENETDIKRSDFPADFLFGTATSAYQIEGGYLEDGKSLSNWDVFTRIPGGIENGDNGDVADDHYHRYMEDIDIMQSMGVNAYRFSISWSRILPRGRMGKVNRKGLKFYNRIIDNLLLKGIKPFVTIHHFDLPHVLEKSYGGWLNPIIQEEFVQFAKTCFENFGDRVKYWATINEPTIVAEMAYLRGWYPPAHCSPPFGNCSAGNSDLEPLQAVHNMLLSHAKASMLYRQYFQPKQGGVMGLVTNAFMYEPYHDSEHDRQAVKRALGFQVGWILDPLVYGHYPHEMQRYHGEDLPWFSKEETEVLKGSLDFIGINHYTTLYATDCFHSPCSSESNRPIKGYVNVTGERDGVPIGERTGISRFFVVPKGMEKIMDYISGRYPKVPIIVTENGYAGRAMDDINVLHDIARVEYHKTYLSALARAMRKGADVKGYFIWSLVDNFEWIHGYNVRFGLYYINRTTLSRTHKLSAAWYSCFLKGKNNHQHAAGEDINSNFRHGDNIHLSLHSEELKYEK